MDLAEIYMAPTDLRDGAFSIFFLSEPRMHNPPHPGEFITGIYL